MAEDLMRYDLLAQQALRGVVRASLEIAKKDGLPGDHHFYIAFATKAPGVQMSERLRAQHPDEMTIILQHQFWDLEVGPERFSLTLSFNNVSESLVVPFAAVKGFYDPSVQFGLQFATESKPAVGEVVPQALVASSTAGTEPVELLAGLGESKDQDHDGEIPAAEEPRTDPDDADEPDEPDDADDADEQALTGREAVGGGEVVSLDAFRKK